MLKEFRGAGILNPLDGRRNSVKYKDYAKGDDGTVFWSSTTVQKKEDEDKLWKSESEMLKRGLKRAGGQGEMQSARDWTPQPTIFEYYCNVVPTTYRNLREDEQNVYQFTANSNRITSTHMPSIYIRYGLSPVTVRYSDYRPPFFTFLVQTFGIVGGLFTVAGLVEAVLYRGIQTVQKKFELGKLG